MSTFEVVGGSEDRWRRLTNGCAIAVFSVGALFILVIGGCAFLMRDFMVFRQPCTESSELIVKAATAGEREKVVSLLDGVAVDITDSQGRTPLSCAIEHRRTETSRMLLAHGADPDESLLLLHHDFPLLLAVKFDPAIVGDLLDRGADVDGRPGDRPLVVASARQDGAPSLRELLRRGARRNIASRPDGKSDLVGDAALHEAVVSGSSETVALLLDAGVDPNVKEMDGPLLRAAYARRADVVRMLLDHGANPNQGDIDLFSAWAGARTLASAPIRDLFVSSKTNAVPAVGTFPLSTGTLPAAAPGQRFPALAPPLAVSIAQQDTASALLLLERGADPNKPAFLDLMPLYLAGLDCNTTVASALLTAGATPATVDGPPPSGDSRPSAPPACAGVLALVGR